MYKLTNEGSFCQMMIQRTVSIPHLGDGNVQRRHAVKIAHVDVRLRLQQSSGHCNTRQSNRRWRDQSHRQFCPVPMPSAAQWSQLRCARLTHDLLQGWITPQSWQPRCRAQQRRATPANVHCFPFISSLLSRFILVPVPTHCVLLLVFPRDAGALLHEVLHNMTVTLNKHVNVRTFYADRAHLVGSPMERRAAICLLILVSRVPEVHRNLITLSEPRVLQREERIN